MRFADCPPTPRWPALLALATCLLCAHPIWAQVSASACGPLANAYGPFDYRTDKHLLGIVEGAHFTPQVEALIKGNAGYLAGDIDYTLRAFPNHHRALISMMRYGERLKLPRVPHARYDVECYFVRATTFRPDDTTVRMLYASFLGKQKRKEEGLQQLEQVQRLAGNKPFTHYNLGLMYFELGAFDKALAQAHLARSLGFPREELMNQLKSVNQWSEPVAAPEAAASAASALQ